MIFVSILIEDIAFVTGEIRQQTIKAPITRATVFLVVPSGTKAESRLHISAPAHTVTVAEIIPLILHRLPTKAQAPLKLYKPT